MKKYLTFFRLRFSMGLQYRAAALAGMATQFAWGFLQIMVFHAFYEADPEAFPMTFSASVSYVWLQQAFLALFASWQMEDEIFQTIVNGNIAYELCRPIHIYHMWFSRSLATRLSRAILRCLPILVVAALLPAPYGILAPASDLHFMLFLFTLTAGLLVTAALCMLVYVLTFFTISSQGLRMVFVAMTDFFSGGIIPIPFFPEELRAIVELSPFAAMQNAALQIYSGSLPAAQMQKTVWLQLFWLAALTLLGYLLSRYAEHRVTVQGG